MYFDEKVTAEFQLSHTGTIDAMFLVPKGTCVMHFQALTLQPNDKNCLVARSKCYVKTGDSVNALLDAEAALKEDKEFFKVYAFFCCFLLTDVVEIVHTKTF